MQPLLPRKLLISPVRGRVERCIHQTRDVEPCSIVCNLHLRGRARKAGAKGGLGGAGNGSRGKTLGLPVRRKADGIAALLDAVGHGLKPREVRGAAVVARDRHGHAHVHPAHVHAGHRAAVVKGGAAEVELGERIVA